MFLLVGCGDGSKKPKLTGVGKAPASLRPSNGPPVAGFAAGIYTDGWVDQDSAVLLRGGGREQLRLLATVPESAGQQIEVRVDGQIVYSGATKAGPLSVAVPIPPSSENRRIDLHFAETIDLQAPDTRTAAAILRFIGVGPVPPAPTAIIPPKGLTDPGAAISGIFPDGWCALRSSATLAGGGDATLTVRMEVPGAPGQRIRVFLNGKTLLDESATGTLVARLPVPAASGDRHVAIRFSKTIRLQAPDTRRAAARLVSLSIDAPVAAPRVAKLPRDVDKPGLQAVGVNADGWAQASSMYSLAGGAPADLAVRALVARPGASSLAILIDGVQFASLPAAAGILAVHLPLPAAAANRRLELRFLGTDTSSSGQVARIQSLRLNAQKPAPIEVEIPRDLQQGNVEESGFFADGWVGADAMIVLQGGGPAQLTLSGRIPTMPAGRLTVTVNGIPVASRRVSPGGIDVVIRLDRSVGNRLVSLHFTRTSQLASPDLRTVSAFLTSIAITSDG